ncbi:MAG: EamA family transporter RarD [Rhodospirillaceae bacterium]
MKDQSAHTGCNNASVTGALCALSAFLIWGVFPLYFRALSDVPAFEVLAHRVVWSTLLVGLVAVMLRHGPQVWAIVKDWRRLGLYFCTSVLITINWLVFIYAVGHDQVLQSSLGYYMTPLVNVLLGVLFLSERLSRTEAVAIALVAAGVFGLLFDLGSVPVIGLILAITFGAYGLIRKKIGGDPLIGVLIETSLATPPAVCYLIWTGGATAFRTHAVTTDLLLVVSGLVTAVPLILFAAGANRLRLSTVGLLQYITPTGQFLLAVLYFGEPFTRGHAVAFSCIWIALALVGHDMWRKSQLIPDRPTRATLLQSEL